MDQNQTEYQYTKTINAPVSQVFRSFTNAASLVEWLCNDAKIQKRKGSKNPDKFYLWWMDGYHVFGGFTKFEKHKAVAFTWQGLMEPASTNVEVTFQETSTGVVVDLTHSGLGTGEEWGAVRQEFDKGWTNSLENLKQALETGIDQRYLKYPMMGVYVGDIVNEEVAVEENLPIEFGIKITGVVANMGAEKIKLQDKDILYTLDGRELRDYDDIYAVAQQYKGGDSVPLVYYRGADKKEALLEFSTKPEPKYKGTALGFSEQMAKYYNKINEKLDHVLEDVTDEEADFIPSAGEWSIKEVLAHLIAEERFTYQWAISWVMRSQNYFYPALNPNYLKAIIRAYKTVPEMMAELKRVQKEKTIYLSELPQDFVDRKPSYVKLASHFPEDTLEHYKSHLTQFKELVNAARGE